MGAETVNIFATLELDLDATAPGTLNLLTALSGSPMALRYTAAVPATARRPVRFRLPGILKGNLLQIQYFPGPGVSHLYSGRIYAREMPNGAWRWYDLGIPPTVETFTAVPLPIPPTQQDWQAAPLPIPAIGEWKPVPLPIPPTQQDWQAVALPFKQTPKLPDWVEVPVDE